LAPPMMTASVIEKRSAFRRSTPVQSLDGTVVITVGEASAEAGWLTIQHWIECRGPRPSVDVPPRVVGLYPHWICAVGTWISIARWTQNCKSSHYAKLCIAGSKKS